MDNTITLPPEYCFDVEKAARSLQALADDEPNAPILLTLAQVGDDGLEGESEVRTTAAGAAALLATVGQDQSLKAGGRNLYVLRVTRAEELPRPEEEW
jgi:hypothetical protein